MGIAINGATTVSAVPLYVPAGVLWYTQDTEKLYIGTGSSESPNVTEIGHSGGSENPGIYAADYGVVGDGHFVFGISVAEGQSTITYSKGGFLTTAKIGQIAFATNLGSEGGQAGAAIVVPQGTITQINSDIEITVSSIATGTLASGGCLVWGVDETTNLENAWAAAVAGNTNLILPGASPEGTRAVILVQSPQLNSDIVYGTGGSRSGIGAVGGGINATYIVPTPNFAFPPSGGCFLGVNDGGYFSDFTIFGAGNGQCYTGANPISAVLITDQNNVTVQDMAFLAWGAASTNALSVGVLVSASQAIIRRCDFDMFGQTGVKCEASGNLGYQSFLNCSFWDNIYGNLYVAGGSNTPVFTHACNFGTGSRQCVSVNGGGIWRDFGSQIGAGVEFFNGILLGYTTLASGTITGTGSAYLTGSDIEMSFENGGSCLYLNSASCTAVLSGCTLNNLSGSGTYCLHNNGGNLTDGGGNVFTTALGSALYSGTGNVFGALSITGAAQTATNITLANFGSSPTVSAVSGSSRVQQLTITVGGTPTGTATMGVLFPVPFLVSPICRADIVGGTNTTLGSFVPSAITSTNALFTYQGTLVGSDTLIVQVLADVG